MSHNQAYLQAEKKIEEALKSGAIELHLNAKHDAEDDEKLTEIPDSLWNLSQLQVLNLSNNNLTILPETLGQLTQLQSLYLSNNKLTLLPESLGDLTQLRNLHVINNKLIALPKSLGQLINLTDLIAHENLLTTLPDSLRNLSKLETFYFSCSTLKSIPLWYSQLLNLKTIDLTGLGLTSVPDWIKQFPQLTNLYLDNNQLTSIPDWIGNFSNLRELVLHNNPLNPELAEASEQGIDAVKLYLRAGPVVPIYEAKLILVGEGEVGKTCLMDALLDKVWQEHPSTHGIEIQQIKITDADSKTENTLNGWDFGGQRVYRPTHQLFFSAPAVYLVVWKPREGSQQGFVKEWIQLVKRREPTAKIIVVATHGGPQQRQPDIDRQELWDTFGKETVVDFFFVDSKPDAQDKRKGIAELKQAIARVAATLPEVGRSVPKSFQGVRETLQQRNVPYLPFDEVLGICREHKMDDEVANLFIKISHRLGIFTHYENDPTLRDIVILRPDWLASAMSYVLDDEQTRHANGLVDFSRLGLLWNDSSRPVETRYPDKLHRIFLRLMERFDLSYRVAGLSPNEETNPVSLIAQLVPDNTPEEKVFEKAWSSEKASGDIQQTQICRIVDEKGNSANAEGLFFQLIVRLHRFSLGRAHYDNSMHWQRGLVLDDEYNGRALLRHIGNDVHITVRAAFPERFLALLTSEVKYLAESFWEGLRCDVMVPCIDPCGKDEPGTGMFEVEKLITFRKQGMTAFPCMVSGCNKAQNIGLLLRNAPVATAVVNEVLFAELGEVKAELAKARQQIMYVGEKTMGRFDRLDDRTRRILSQVDKTYTDLLHVLTDEAKEGPRLFSLVPVDRNNFNPKEWISAEFKLTLWCEHSGQPLNSPDLDGVNSTKGIYTFEIEREWFKKVAPYLRVVMGVLSLALPVVSSGVKLRMDDNAYKAIEEQLDFGKSAIEASIGVGEKVGEWMGETATTSLGEGDPIRAQGAMLREFHALLKSVDKSGNYGGLRKVLNKHQEFLWVHEKFAGEY